jgi:hypothetical protein
MAAEPLLRENELQVAFDYLRALYHKPRFPFCWRLIESLPPSPIPVPKLLCTADHAGPSWLPYEFSGTVMAPCSYNHYSRMLLVTPDLRMHVAWPAGDRLTMILNLLRPFQDRNPSPSRLISMLLELMHVDILDYDAGSETPNHREVF